MSEQLRREGDDLAARLGDLPARLRRMAATMEDFGNPTGAADLREAATRLREADRKFAVCERALHGSELARASTHPEQSGQVDPEDVAAISDYFMGDEEFSGPAEKAWSRILPALEPASPTPTEQGEARVTCDRCGCEQDERTCCGNCGAAIGFSPAQTEQGEDA